jgi:serine/threonine protein kinase
MLSEGGMGSIWVAEHLTLGTQVAVKFIASELVENAAMLARFQLEATSAAQIKSPHVVQMFDHGVTDEGQPYIVMELLHGEDLDQRIERKGKLAPAETALVVQHACKALGAAHKLRVVHRDIKPANLFVLETDGEIFVKVLDFGIAKRRSDSVEVTGVTNTGAMVGTPHYMSPEQVTSARHVDASADLWAVAVVAYNCLLGRRPFEGETVGALCIAIHAGRFLAPTQVDPTRPPALDAWFARALARDPADRFPSARELSDSFAACLSGGARSPQPEPGTSVPARERLSSAPTLAERSVPPPSAAGSSVSVRSAPQTLGGASVKTDPGKTRSRTLVGAAVLLAAIGGVTVWLGVARSGREPAAASTTVPVTGTAPASVAPSPTVVSPDTTTTMVPETATLSPPPTPPTAASTGARTPPNAATAVHPAPRASHAPAPPGPTPPSSPTPKDRGF